MSCPQELAHQTLRYSGCNYFRQRVVLATLFQKSLVLNGIRDQNCNPGLRRYEATLLRLIDKITDGSFFHIDVTGTELRYSPGCLIGGDDLFHDCGTERNLSYFLEALLLLAPFAKKPLFIRLKGITHGSCVDSTNLVMDPSVDLFRSVLPSLMKKIHPDFANLKVNVIKRSFSPEGEGEVTFFCPTIRKVAPFKLLQSGRVKRVRGIAVTNHVSSQFAVRMIDRVRWGLNDLLPDVWVYHIAPKQNECGPSPGYGITLVTETIKGCMKGVDVIYNEDIEKFLKKEHHNSKQDPPLSHIVQQLLDKKRDPENGLATNYSSECPTPSVQEFMGLLAVKRLLMEVHQSGVIGTAFQYMPLLFMALAEEHQLCEIKMPRLTPYTIQFLRHLKDFSSVVFGVEECEQMSDSTSESDTDANSLSSDESSSQHVLPSVSCVVLKCIGVGYRNLGKTTI